MAKETTTAGTPAMASDVGKTATENPSSEAAAGANAGALPADPSTSAANETGEVGTTTTNTVAPATAELGAAGAAETATLGAGAAPATAQDAVGAIPPAERLRPSLDVFRRRIAGVASRSAALTDQFDMSPLSVGSDAIRELASLVHELAATFTETMPDED